MPRVLICGLLAGGLMLASACDTEPPTAPGPVPPPPVVTEPPAPPPPPARPLPGGKLVATYVYSGTLDYVVRDFTVGSQYFLYDDGVFGLRFEAHSYIYWGTYLQDGTTITFRFDGDASSADEIATGTLKGDLLEVRYSELMQHSDFENAVYRRQ
jgi:hypothetical protein